MTVELTMVGVRCNLSCNFCYQNPIRDGGNFSPGYDLAAMRAGVEREGGPFTLFGGEPLLAPIDDVETMLAWGFQKWGQSSLQTNGSLVTEKHIELFARYNVSVGISIDGPGELNDVRWAGSLEKTRDMTARTEAAIRKLCAARRPPGLIVTLYRPNVQGARLERMQTWFRELDAIGIRHVRLHLLEVDHDLVAEHLRLSDDENIRAMLAFAALEPQLTQLRFDVFRDLEALLLGQDDNVTCVWTACDPMTTPAVRGVDGLGNRSNCHRTDKDGFAWEKADKPGFERQLALYHAPQEYGGCNGCRFFFACKSECPGTGLDGDWRQRTDQCRVWFSLFEAVEGALARQGRMPISLDPALRARVEAAQLAAWADGRNLSVRAAGGADVEHGDVPHGDRAHGDHDDEALLK